jgi:opacity protein-like surface antigen
MSTDLRVGTERVSRGGDTDWTDALVGVTASGPIVKNVSWDTTVEAGFGGSDGTYRVSAGVTWRFAKNWSTRLGYSYTAIDFEKGSKGDSDWYKYDVDESAASLNVMFNW